MRHFFLIMAFCLTTVLGYAQPAEQPAGPRFDPQRFQQMVEQALTKAGDLTADEARAFFPLYNEMRGRQREMGRQMHELKCSTPVDDKAYSTTVLRIKKLQVEMAELEQGYYKRILRVIPAEKVFKMMKAEDDFHRRMVRGQRGQRGKKEQRGAAGQHGSGEHRGRR